MGKTDRKIWKRTEESWRIKGGYNNRIINLQNILYYIFYFKAGMDSANIYSV